MRDDKTGEVWSPQRFASATLRGVYIARHGRGYSCFEHGCTWCRRESSSVRAGRRIDKDIAPPLDEQIEPRPPPQRDRLCRVGARRVEIRHARIVETECDVDDRRDLARNPSSRAFGSRVAFADMRGAQTDWTGDRREFIGRNRTLAIRLHSRARRRCPNGGRGPGPMRRDARETGIVARERRRSRLLLGEAATHEDARAAIQTFRAADLDALEADIARNWDATLDAIEVKTPDRAMDLMLNGWLIYQTLACRIWARSAFYQASGAYGFRDQLQDGMALAAVRPDLTREHLLRAAARQFAEGDVQHWWLPHSGQGVRTRISDDRAWLAYTVAQYVETTQDTLVLDELLPFLEGAPLEAGETDRFLSRRFLERASPLFEHCALALDASLAVGRHGLPLIGTGDWNDGMNRVGEKGDGESVWLGWFLHAALTAFAPLALARDET